MIVEETIQGLLADLLSTSNLFIVEIKVKPGNKIMVLADTPKGITIDECVSISRAIEHNLDREVEDFELEVSSPGLLQPFKVTEQYKKYTDKHVDVVLKTGQKLSGKLISSTESGFVLETKDKRKTVAKKKPEVVIEQHALAYEEVKSTILVVIF